MSASELKYVPFHSWQCITLQLSHRDVDLVIPNEKDMDKFLQFLIHSMYTVDGVKGSATKLLDLMQKQDETLYKQKEKKDFISESVR